MKALYGIAAALALAGCAGTIQGGTTEEKAFAIFGQICAAEPVMHAAFITLSPGRVGTRVIEAEAKAHIIVSGTCAASPTDWQSALAAVSVAFADVLRAQQYAERMAGVQR